VLLLATVIAVHRSVRRRGLAGRRATGALVVGAALMLVGNLLSF
jgi:hypothetical protein